MLRRRFVSLIAAAALPAWSRFRDANLPTEERRWWWVALDYPPPGRVLYLECVRCGPTAWRVPVFAGAIMEEGGSIFATEAEARAKLAEG